MKLRQFYCQGFTLIEVMIAVAISGLLLAAVTQSMIAYETRSRARACADNLIRIDSAVRQWALDGHKADTTSVNLTPDLVGADKYLTSNPVCPAGGTYTTTTVASAPTCSIGTNNTVLTNDDHIMP